MPLFQTKIGVLICFGKGKTEISFKKNLNPKIMREIVKVLGMVVMSFMILVSCDILGGDSDSEKSESGYEWIGEWQLLSDSDYYIKFTNESYDTLILMEIDNKPCLYESISIEESTEEGFVYSEQMFFSGEEEKVEVTIGSMSSDKSRMDLKMFYTESDHSELFTLIRVNELPYEKNECVNEFL